MVGGRHHDVVYVWRPQVAQQMDGAVRVLVEVPVYLLQGKEGAPIQGQVMLG
jgi:hypothetical protein